MEKENSLLEIWRSAEKKRSNAWKKYNAAVVNFHGEDYRSIKKHNAIVEKLAKNAVKSEQHAKKAWMEYANCYKNRTGEMP